MSTQNIKFYSHSQIQMLYTKEQLREACGKIGINLQVKRYKINLILPAG